MKNAILEELKRIHTLTYKEKKTVNKIIDSLILNEVDEPKKADFITTDVNDFYNTLKSIGTLKQQRYGTMTYQKQVEALQIALMLLGYDLPRFGADGYFGKETAAAVDNFKADHGLDGSQQVNENVMISPVSTNRVSSKFREKRGGSTHSGVDFAVPSGTPIKSPLNGKVIFAEFKNTSCGGTIQIDHGNGYVSRYCHCKAINVKKGQTVKIGEVIGLTGGGKGDVGAGKSTGPHLHMELKVNNQLVDPLLYIKKEQVISSNQNTVQQVKQQLASITPDFVKVLIDKLMGTDIEPMDLSNFVDAKEVSNLTDNQAYQMILKQLGAPVTDENMKFLYAWRQSEGRLGLNNPFNTTYRMPGAKTVNSHGVKSYKTIEDGIKATVRSLKSERYDYSCIVNGLIKNVGAKNIAKCESLKTWGTGDLVQQVLRGYDNGAPYRIKPLN